jgi:nitrous oxidase accessory protein
MAVQVPVPPAGDALRAAVAAARAGDVLLLMAGRHAGPVVISRPLVLRGAQGAVVDGGGSGRVITVDAPGVTIEGLTVTGSGLDLSTEDAGIFITPRGEGARIEGNRIIDNLIGVYLKGPRAAEVRANVIEGRRDLRVNERGNGVQMWNTPGSVVIDNKFRYGRDGIFVTTSRDNQLVHNDFRDLRFAVHYMYTNDSEISDNRSVGNHIGYALMYSHRLRVTGNVSSGDRDRGLLLNYANDSEIAGNRVFGVEKCVFIYNANGNRIRHNHFEGCDIGVHFTAGSEANDIYGNSFIGSRTQVKYVGTRHLEWSHEGKGNYWSDNTAFDLDGDGVGDRPYRPNGLVDHVLWRHPRAKLLLGSPAMQVLAWVQSAFPGLHPGGVIDSAPLMVPIDLPARGIEQ